MKKRLLILFLTAVLALGVTLTACGDKDQGASPDSATADTATPDSSSAVSSSVASSSAASSAASKEDSSSESDKKASSAPAAGSNGGNSNNNNANDNKQEEQKSSSSPANNNSNNNGGSSQSSSKAAPASKPSSGNPAYKDGEKPSYTITMTNKNTKKSYSVGCSYSKDDDKLVTTTFYLPGGDYSIAVYKYTEEKEKGDPEATGTYQNDIKEKERRSIRVTYNIETGKFKVEEIKSDRKR